MKHDADDAIARLLRDQAPEPGPAAGSCLDADTVAAWFDGTLTQAEQRAAESHASICARCQTLLATMAEVEPVTVPPRRSVTLIRWLVPVVAAAAAVMIWINVAGRTADVPQGVSEGPPAAAPAPPPDEPLTLSQRAHTEPAPSAASTTRLEKRAPADAAEHLEARSTESTSAPRKVLGTPGETSKPAVSPAPQASNAPAPPGSMADQEPQSKDGGNAALERDAAPLAASIVRSADGVLWRISARGEVARSDDGGTTWRDQNLGSPARVLAGSSPSPNVVWFGAAGGLVVMTADGVSWQQRFLPERVDVARIAADDARTALVTTSDGRRFVTHDGGLTWIPASVQGNPAAPF